MPGYVAWAVRDFDSEIGRIKFHGAAITAVNHDAQVALQVTLAAAIEGIITGTLANKTYGNFLPLSAAAPSDEWSQRETGFLASFYDATEIKRFKTYIPTADLELLNEAETDPNLRKSVPLGSGAGATFKAAVEAYAQSPWGHAVVLEKLVHVSRNT
jgi:hypothetical protein